MSEELECQECGWIGEREELVCSEEDWRSDKSTIEKILFEVDFNRCPKCDSTNLEPFPE